MRGCAVSSSSFLTVVNDAKKLRFLVFRFHRVWGTPGRGTKSLIDRLGAGFSRNFDQSNRQNLFTEKRRINKGLDQIMSRLGKLEISKKSNVIGMSIIGDLECRRRRNRNGRNSVRTKDANFGEVLPVSEEEWVQLASVLSPDPTEGAIGAVADAKPKSSESTITGNTTPDAGSKAPSVAERIQRMLKK